MRSPLPITMEARFVGLLLAGALSAEQFDLVRVDMQTEVLDSMDLGLRVDFEDIGTIGTKPFHVLSGIREGFQSQTYGYFELSVKEGLSGFINGLCSCSAFDCWEWAVDPKETSQCSTEVGESPWSPVSFGPDLSGS